MRFLWSSGATLSGILLSHKPTEQYNWILELEDEQRKKRAPMPGDRNRLMEKSHACFEGHRCVHTQGGQIILEGF